jgi:mono/diheme cytochrome c family protein
MGVKSEIPVLEKHGWLKAHPFVPAALRTVDETNRVEAGRAIALAACSNCHSLSATGMRPLARYFSPKATEAEIATYLQAALAGGNTLYMPQIPLPDDEARALAAWIRTEALAGAPAKTATAAASTGPALATLKETTR